MAAARGGRHFVDVIELLVGQRFQGQPVVDGRVRFQLLEKPIHNSDGTLEVERMKSCEQKYQRNFN